MELPQSARQLLQTIGDTGAHAAIYGEGAVRAALHGGPLKGRLATSADPWQLRELFGTSLVFKDGADALVLEDMELSVRYLPGEGREVFLKRLQKLLSGGDFTYSAIAFVNGGGQVRALETGEDLEKRQLRALHSAEEAFLKAPELALRAVRLAAELGFSLEGKTGQAALAATPLFSRISAATLRRELSAILLSDAPDAAEPLLRAGAFSAFGIPLSGASLATLRALPPVPVLRWWAFLQLAGASVSAAAQGLSLPGPFADALQRVGSFASMAKPITRQALKLQLLQDTPVPVEQIATTLRLFDPQSNLQQVYDELLDSGEPFPHQQLAVSFGTLAQEGYTGKQRQRIANFLLQAVIREPQLNQRDTLLAIAREARDLF